MATDPGWALETALDIDMVSAACPSCKILLVEADNDLFINLLTAVAEARTPVAGRPGRQVRLHELGRRHR
ncbi:hypothetical protein ACGFYU_06985 [Streptomyces sp. NPDC048337]|uniref:hypothetical protein n=1 Tax=Streptomyces sp. NPDC048337 TaxID=3365535 RepID=UPI003716340B